VGSKLIFRWQQLKINFQPPDPGFRANTATKISRRALAPGPVPTR
jgi:hypothetical protein